MTRNPWLENLFRPLVIGAMVACIAQSLVELARLVFPAWNGAFLIAGCILAALEANYSYRIIRDRRILHGDLVRFRIIEAGGIFILLKIGSYIGDSWSRILAEIQNWPRNPFAIFDAEVTAASILAALSWWVSTQTTYDLEHIGEPPELHSAYVSPRMRLVERFVWGGWILLTITGLTRFLAGQSMPRLVANVMLYFLLGLTMTGQLQLTALRLQWQKQKTPVAAGLPRRWTFYSLLFTGVVTLLSLLLPTRYTLGLLETIGSFLQLVGTLILHIASLILFGLSWLSWLLLGGEPPTRPEPEPEAPPSEQPVVGPTPGAAGADWLQVLGSLFFWAVTIGMLVYIVRSYLRDHPEILRALSGLKLVQALRRLWRFLQEHLTRVSKTIRQQIPRRLIARRRARQQPAQPLRLLRLSALSPRERVRYHYLSVLQRARQQGFPRRRTQTPYEYNAVLSPHLPQAQEDFEQLTQSFVEARYSAHPIDREQERYVRTHRDRVKAALRMLKRQKS